MSQRIKKYLPILKRINRLAEKTKKQYVKKSSKDFLDCLSECAKNVLLRNVPLSSRQNAKLSRSKTISVCCKTLQYTYIVGRTIADRLY